MKYFLVNSFQFEIKKKFWRNEITQPYHQLIVMSLELYRVFQKSRGTQTFFKRVKFLLLTIFNEEFDDDFYFVILLKSKVKVTSTSQMYTLYIFKN